MSTNDDVCGTCGVRVALAGSGSYVHTDSLPEGVEPHDATTVTSREKYLFDRRPKMSPGERSAVALERLADAVERYLAIQEERERTAWQRPT